MKPGDAIRDRHGAWWIVEKVKKRKIVLRIDGQRFDFPRAEVEGWL